MKSILHIALIVCLLGLYVFLCQTFERKSDYRIVESAPLVNQPENIINISTLGFRNIYEDVIMIWALQILMHDKVAELDQEKVFNVMLEIARKQPTGRSFYQLACYTFITDYDKPEYCEPIMVLGMEKLTNSFRLPFIQASVLNHMMHDQEKANIYYRIAAGKKKSPEWVKRFVRKKFGGEIQDLEDINKLLEVIGMGSGSDTMKQKIIDDIKKDRRK